MRKPPQRHLFCFAFVLAASVSANFANAHMLNMTHIEVQTHATEPAEITLRIDLGQSLLTAQDYWTLSNATSPEQTLLMQNLKEQLTTGLKIEVDGRPAYLNLQSWDFPAVSLTAIENPLTPQMATLSFHLSVIPRKHITVGLANNFSVPWPALVRLDIAGRELPVSRLLTAYDRSTASVSLQGTQDSEKVDIGALMVVASQAWLPGLSWVVIGFQHIIPRGLDHIAFVLGLFFLTAGMRPLLLQVTGFTIAHSLTLALAMYGFVSVPAAIVEPLIAASIVYVALDNLYASHLAPFRMFVVCAFGLLHGLGFAAVLQDIQMPQENFAQALLLFNVGVELGQLAVIAGAFALVGAFRKRTWYSSGIAHPATMGIAGVGAYWLLKRTVF
ncbi:MAG: HupE/UreJ family protein [bacterium]